VLGREERSAIIFSTRSLPISALWSFTLAFTCKVFEFHRLLAKRFPYAVYYRIDGETCIVFRVLDGRQEPEKTMEGLR
jgi:hypothetical protein